MEDTQRDRLRRVDFINEGSAQPCSGYLHGWSTVANAGETYPCAIVEDESGKVHEVRACSITFLSAEEIRRRDDEKRGITPVRMNDLISRALAGSEAVSR